MTKKVLIILSVFFVICISIFYLIKSKSVDNSNDVNSYLSIMLETDSDSGQYELSTTNKWPESGYVFNESKSYCINGSEISWNNSSNTIDLVTYKEDKCNVYFDIQADITLDVSLENIVIDEGSSENKLYVSGGGLENKIEIDNSVSIIITGTTETNGITVNGGKSNITLNNVNIKTKYGTFRLFNNSVVNLNLNGENILDASPSESSISSWGTGLYVSSESKIVIDGSGVLNAIGKASGIGNSYMNKTGTIIINSGTIIAKSVNNGAGIGGYDISLIEINGGNVTALGYIPSDYEDYMIDGTGAGIGGTFDASLTGEIIINGGDVYAKGGLGAAGIGGGGPYASSHYYTTAPYISISSKATVEAIAGPQLGTIFPQNIGNGGNADR